MEQNPEMIPTSSTGSGHASKASCAPCTSKNRRSMTHRGSTDSPSRTSAILAMISNASVPGVENPSAPSSIANSRSTHSHAALSSTHGWSRVGRSHVRHQSQ